MRSLLELVYQYRRLLGRCDSEAGLEMAEIEELAALEATLRSAPPPTPGSALRAHVRGGRADDAVDLTAVGPTAMRLERCPYVEPGTKVEVVIDDADAAQTYRFKALVVELDDGDDDLFRASLQLVGAPLLLRRRPRTVELVAEAA